MTHATRGHTPSHLRLTTSGVEPLTGSVKTTPRATALALAKRLRPAHLVSAAAGISVARRVAVGRQVMPALIAGVAVSALTYRALTTND